MPKIKDLSPKFKIPVAEKELELLIGQKAMGSREGGLSLYSTKFKRGYGDAVFGSDENGIWLGAAEFADAVFRVDMDGSLQAKEAIFKDEDDTTIIDAKGLVSTASFASGSTYYAAVQKTTNNGSWVDVANSSLNIVLGRTTNVLCMASALAYSNGDGVDDCILRMNIGGVARNTIAIAKLQFQVTVPMFGIYELSAGTNVFKLQTQGATNDDLWASHINVMYVVLGK